MSIRFDRIEKAQALMREQNMMGIMIMNHDDYRYFFGRDWSQPRAILPFQGPPILIVFAAEEPEIKAYVGDAKVEIFTQLGEQIQDVTSSFREIFKLAEEKELGEKPKVGMQMWFDTPAFLVDLFRKVNPQFELVPSDSVMDPMRTIKDLKEIEFMRAAQSIATLGMNRVREMLKPGVTAHELATEALYTMMNAGAEGTSTPIRITFGLDTCMIHGRVSTKPLEEGDLVVVDLTPQVEGYCANLARTFVLGELNEAQRRLFETYREMIDATCQMMKPGVTVREMDALGAEICKAHGFGEYHIDGISHGIGLRFEEIPASTIIKQHRNIELREGMTMTIGHTILAIPGFGGVRHEDVYRVGLNGGEVLFPYPAGRTSWSILA
jgi:Xaa-Pro dipeptidase